MEERKREIRSAQGGHFQPHLREALEGEGSGRTIEGYAIVFGVESRMLVDYWDDYREIIEPGAITEQELAQMDIKMTMWHNREKLLARSNKGVGTLKLSVDDIGVKYEFEAPNTSDGNNALELVKRGDMGGSSFTYWSDESSAVNYTKNEDDVLIRHVKKIGMVYEMTIASDPAYTQTSVTAREIERSGLKISNEDEVKRAEEIRKREQAIREVRQRSKQRFFN
uniref:HK97 family phage prohead protease n=1 Tax=Bacteroides ovatus TaxID=28116 RepID=UPI00359C11B2